MAERLGEIAKGPNRLTVQITPCVILEQGTIYRVSDQDFEAFRRAVEEGVVSGRYITTQDIVEEDGTLFIEVLNGSLVFDQQRGQTMLVGNDSTISFPPDGLQLSYEASGYRQNFLRGIVLLWVKLAFLAMFTIAASTFLSFPVACLVSFGAFLAAEGSGYLLQSIQLFGWSDDEGNLQVLRFIAGMITLGVANLFRVYDLLNPIDSIVNGKLIAWGDTLVAMFSLAVASAVLYVAGALSFARRELAMYSGK